MRIAVYTCMKNERANVDGWIQSCWDADEIVVLDTGSTDGTLQRLREPFIRADDPLVRKPFMRSFFGLVSPWRFDVALNAALTMVHPDMDVCIQLSADERLTLGWRERIEAIWADHSKYWLDRGREPSDVFKIHYNYQFEPELTFLADRCHSRRGYTWRWPFHEALCAAHGQLEDHAWILGDPLIVQTQNKTVDRMTRDLDLAVVAVAEWPDCSRMAFYAGRQHMYAGNYRQALHELMRAEEINERRPGAQPLERQWCHEAIARCWAAIGAGAKT